MNYFELAFDFLILISASLYIGYHLTKDLQKHIPVLYRKWIKGECRRTCFNCKNSSQCRYELGLEPEYTDGFNDGYISGYEDCKRKHK